MPEVTLLAIALFAGVLSAMVFRASRRAAELKRVLRQLEQRRGEEDRNSFLFEDFNEEYRTAAGR